METGDKAVVTDTINYMKEVNRAKVKGSMNGGFSQFVSND